MKTYVKYTLIAWLVFILLLGWFMFEISNHTTALARVASFVVPEMILFYVNLIWLLPQFLDKKPRIYGIGIAVLCLAHVFIFAPIDIYMDEHFPLNIPHFSERPPMTIYFGRLFACIPPLVISALLWKSIQLQRQREESLELKHQVAEAETRALKAQINPHFLFNSLNNIYSLSQMKSDKTGDAILQLSEILRFVTYESDKDKVKLTDELKQINNFIQLQLLKDDDQSNISYEISDCAPSLHIAPMLLLPFIENSFKHSNFENKEKGWIKIFVRCDQSKLTVDISNSSTLSPIKKDTVGGVGMENVKKRLSLIYPERHSLTIKQDKDSYNVKLEIDLRE